MFVLVGLNDGREMLDADSLDANDGGDDGECRLSTSV